MFLFWTSWISTACSGFGDSRFKNQLSPNFTPLQGYFSVKSGGS